MEHVFYDREDGLSHCRVCNGAEGTLPSGCPGTRMSERVAEAVYAGQIDFRAGSWLRLPPKPGAETGQPDPGLIAWLEARFPVGCRVRTLEHHRAGEWYRGEKLAAPVTRVTTGTIEAWEMHSHRAHARVRIDGGHLHELHLAGMYPHTHVWHAWRPDSMEVAQ